MPKVIVQVMPKPSVLDPQGAAVAGAMKHCGMSGVRRVRAGRAIEIEFESAPDMEKLREISRDLLSNPVIEDFEITVLP